MAEHGWGAKLMIGGTSGTNLASVTNITLAGQSRTAIPTSSMDSPSKYNEFMPGMVDAGEITLDLLYDGTTITQLLHSQMTATANIVTLTFYDGTTTASKISCRAFLTDLGHQIPMDDAVTQSVSFKLTGVPTFST